PAVREGGGQDVVAQLAGEPLRAAEIAEDGQVLEELVEAPQPQRPAEQRLLPARVDQEARRHLERRALRRDPAQHGRGAAGVHLLDRVLLVHLRAAVARVLQEQLVELGTDDLVGVGPAAWILAKPEAPRLALPSPLERAAGLAEEAVRLDAARG